MKPVHLHTHRGMPAASVGLFPPPAQAAAPHPYPSTSHSRLDDIRQLSAPTAAPLSFAPHLDAQAGPSRLAHPGPTGVAPLGVAQHASALSAPFAPSAAIGTAAANPGKRTLSQFMLPQDQTPHIRRRRRPPYSYAGLIAQAINSSPEGRLTLREIYQWISAQFPTLYPMSGSDSQGWQNTVRHNLSLNKAFTKQARTARDGPDTGSSGPESAAKGKGAGAGSGRRSKGGFWTLDPVRGAALLNALNKGENGDELSDREQGKEPPSKVSRTPTTSAAGSITHAMGIPASSAPPSTAPGSSGQYPSVLMTRPRSDSGGDGSSLATSARGAAASGTPVSGLSPHSTSIPNSFYQLNLPPTTQGGQLQHSMYSPIPVDAAGRPRGYTIAGSTDHVRDQAWFPGSMAGQTGSPSTVPSTSYGMSYAADSSTAGNMTGHNNFGPAGDRYGMRARHQTSTGIPNSATSAPFNAGNMAPPPARPDTAFVTGSNQHGMGSLQYPNMGYPPRTPQQWSMSTSSGAGLPGSTQAMGMGSFGNMGTGEHAGAQSDRSNLPGIRTADDSAARGHGAGLRAYDGGSMVGGGGTRTIMSTNIMSSSGDTPAMHFPPSNTNSAYGGLSQPGHDGTGSGLQQFQQQQQQQHYQQQQQHHMGMFTPKDDDSGNNSYNGSGHGSASTSNPIGNSHNSNLNSNSNNINVSSYPRTQDSRGAHDWQAVRHQFNR